MIALFGAALALRNGKVLTEQHAGVFAKAMTQLVLPALVFGHLAAHRIRWEMLDAPARMFSSGVLLMLLGYVVGRWVFRLARPSLGAVMICTGFTSAAFLGIALVEIVYPHDGNMEKTALIAELGVGVPVFVLGPLIAAYFGVRGDGDAFSIVRGLLHICVLRSTSRSSPACCGVVWRCPPAAICRSMCCSASADSSRVAWSRSWDWRWG